MKTHTAIIGIIIFFAIASFIVFKQPETKISDNAISSHHPSNPNSVFQGKITNKKVNPGKITGMGAYDRNCVAVENGLTNCHAGINTNEYGLLDFNYVHDMARDPCIVPGDNVVVEIADAEGNAAVRRA